MFSIGEKVACIVDGWESPECDCKFPLRRNQVLYVKASFAPGAELGRFILQEHVISIGYVNEPLQRWSAVVGSGISDHDLWSASWFRRLERKDISEGLATLIGLFDTTKAREGIDA